MKKEKKDFVELKNAKSKEYQEVLKKIQADDNCPFCPENFRYHKGEVLHKSGNWFITPNAYSYKDAGLALLIVCNIHKENFDELTAEDFLDISALINWAIKKYKIKGGGFGMRFGDPEYTGATVRHLHAHLIVPKPGEPVYFPIG